MPLVPEKLNSRQEVRNVISSQFWDQPVHSVRSLDGTARTLPCEPPPIGQTAASGLLRSQALLVSQAAGVRVMPGFSTLDGGLKDILTDLENYSISSRSKATFGRNASLNYLIEAPNARDLHRVIRRRSSRAMRRSNTEQSKPAYKAQAWLRYHLPGHDLVGTTAWNQEYVDSAASYCTVPHTVSCDLASTDRPDGIQYRVGLHQVSAPEVEGSSLNLHSLPVSSQAQVRSSLHVQGAVAVEGEAHIWRPGRKNSSTSSSDVGANDMPPEKDMSNGVPESASEISKAVEQEIAVQKDISAQGHKNASSPSARRLPNSTHFPVRVQPALSQTSSPAPPDGFPSDDVAAVDGHQSGTNHADALDSSAAVTPQSRSDEQQQPSHSADDIDQPSSSVTDRQETGNVPQDAQTKAQRKRKPRTAWPAVQKPAAGSSGSVLVDQYSSPISDSEDSDAEAAQQPLLKHLTAISIQSSIAEAQANIQKLRQILTVVSAGVQEGKVQLEHQEQTAPARKHKRQPYSPWLSQPCLKVNAAVGCLARMPLPHSAFRPLESRFDDNQPQGPLNRPSSRFSPDLWQPYLRDTALRIFGSVGLTGQLGRFTRPVLDFTAGSVRLDFGLTSPHRPSLAPVSSYGNLSVFNPRQDHLDSAGRDQGVASTSRPLGTRFKNRAFALEGRGIWHALSASLTQQLIGPVRLRGDLRCALDLPSSVEQDAAGKRTWRKFREAAQKTRPTLLETTIGLDIVIPGSSGVARAAIWYSPKRKEGMAEIKLF